MILIKKEKEQTHGWHEAMEFKRSGQTFFSFKSTLFQSFPGVDNRALLLNNCVSVWPRIHLSQFGSIVDQNLSKTRIKFNLKIIRRYISYISFGEPGVWLQERPNHSQNRHAFSATIQQNASLSQRRLERWTSSLECVPKPQQRPY